jgi:hypothetical protein
MNAHAARAEGRGQSQWVFSLVLILGVALLVGLEIAVLAHLSAEDLAQPPPDTLRSDFLRESYARLASQTGTTPCSSDETATIVAIVLIANNPAAHDPDVVDVNYRCGRSDRRHAFLWSPGSTPAPIDPTPLADLSAYQAWQAPARAHDTVWTPPPAQTAAPERPTIAHGDAVVVIHHALPSTAPTTPADDDVIDATPPGWQNPEGDDQTPQP